MLLTFPNQKWETRVLASRAADFNGSEGPNPHVAQYTGIGAVAANNPSYNPANSPQLNRTQSPANASVNRNAGRANGMVIVNPVDPVKIILLNNTFSFIFI
jgi:hypothetical protein